VLVLLVDTDGVVVVPLVVTVEVIDVVGTVVGVTENVVDKLVVRTVVGATVLVTKTTWVLVALPEVTVAVVNITD
jgi:hypothetical protein